MIYIASDHAGFDLKNLIVEKLKTFGVDIYDLGPKEFNSVDDYPDYAYELAKKVVEESTKGILICGTGSGMVIVANKLRGAYATLCEDEHTARLARAHNNSNIVVVKASNRYEGVSGNNKGQDLEEYSRHLTNEVILTFLNTEFSNEERHIRRTDKIKAIEQVTMKD